MKKLPMVVDASKSKLNLTFQKQSRNLYCLNDTWDLMIMDKDK